MLKACVIVGSMLVVSPAQAFLDSIADTMKEVAEAAAVSGAVTDLISEVDQNSAPDKANGEVQQRHKDFKSNVENTQYINNETKRLMNGPDTTSERLSQNIRFTTQFVKRAKGLLTKIGFLSPEVQTAVSTSQINTQLNEGLQNDQALLQLQQEQFHYQKVKDLQEQESWAKFAAQQKAIRSRQNGKK